MKALLHLDAHVHLYPLHDWGRLLTSAMRGMPRRGAADIRALLLAERHDCRIFQALSADEMPLPEGWCISAYDPSGAIRLHHASTRQPLWLIAGRQHAVRERVEVCSLFLDDEIPDGFSAEKTVQMVLDAGGIAALNWAPGKWMGKRKKVIANLLEKFSPEKLWLVDTSLRATGIPEPAFYAAARKADRPILAGSDSLPVPGEEEMAGTYYCKIPLELAEPAPVDEEAGSDWDLDAPDADAMIVPALRAALQQHPLPPLAWAGQRNSPMGLLKRLRAHHAARR